MVATAEVYLDNSATTRADPAVAAAVADALTGRYGNPSSLHRLGLEAERIVKRARRAAAVLLDVEPADLVFTSGGTEANNLAIKGAARALRRAGRHVITFAAEHSSVLAAAESLADEGFEVEVLPVGADGRADAGRLRDALRPETILVSMMHVNNEVGSVQPVEEVGRHITAARGDGRHPLLHVDAVQSLGKLPVRPAWLGADLLTLSAHKVHGPKGVGVLYVRRGVRLVPLQHGGEQEQALRPGTENVPGIAGFGTAVELLTDTWQEASERMRGLRRRLIDRARDRFGDVRVNGPLDDSHAAPHIVNLSFPGLPGEVLVHALAEQDIFVSTGSACHSRKAVVSHVLRAMGLPDEAARGAIRVSFSRHTTEGGVDRLLSVLDEIVPSLGALRVGSR